MSGILDLFADNKEVTQLIAKSVPAIMGIHQASKAKNAAEGYQLKLDNIETNRQEIVNPYANVTNPFANMQVATQAAEMQAEQTDIALANTLDTLRSTGAAAGGATALAQAALKSKQGISADIEKQEMANQKLMAQGEQRMQQLQGAGKGIQMNMQENRDLRDITRLQDNMNLAQQQRAAGQATAGMAMASGIAGMSGLIDPKATNTENFAMKNLMDTSLDTLINQQEDLGGSDIEPEYENLNIENDQLTRDFYSSQNLSPYTIRNEAKNRLGTNYMNDPEAAKAQEWINAYHQK